MTEIYYNIERRREAEMLRRRRKRRQRATLAAVIAFLVLAVLAVLLLPGKSAPEKIFESRFTRENRLEKLGQAVIPEWIDVQLLPENGTSRSGALLEDINSIVIHYVGNPGTTAQNNRNYYDNDGVTVNSHFVVGLEGEIIQCIPLNEKSSASNHRNRDTISVEVCHPDETGEFNEITYEALVKLTAWLCEICGFEDEECIIRHYDVTGKYCPLYYVENEDEWIRFKDDVMEYTAYEN